MAGSSGKQTRSQKLRQNMINMMYLVFIAMLALQISKEVLATLGVLSEDMEKSTSELKISIDSAYNIIDQNSNQDYYKICDDEVIYYNHQRQFSIVLNQNFEAGKFL